MLVMVYLLTGDVSFVDMDQRNRFNGPTKPDEHRSDVSTGCGYLSSRG